MSKKYRDPSSVISYYLDCEGYNMELCQWQKLELACSFMAQDPDDYQWMREQDWLNQAMLNNYLDGKTIDIKQVVEDLMIAYYEDQITVLFNKIREERQDYEESCRPRRNAEWHYGAQR